MGTTDTASATHSKTKYPVIADDSKTMPPATAVHLVN